MVLAGNQRPEEGVQQPGPSVEKPVLRKQVPTSSRQEKGTVS